MRNRCVVLKARPKGVAQEDHFAIETRELGELSKGYVRIRNRFLSVEPAMRGWLADAATYSSRIEIGDVMKALAVGHVIQSDHPDYVIGEPVTGWFGWQEIADVPPSAIERRVTETDLPLSLCLGILGMNGLTAWFGLTRVGAPRAGDVVVVSTAAGAVGSAVGQIAKMLGCRTIGIAGGPEKKRLCTDDYHYDAAIDYRAEDIDSALRALCPDGVDVYYDNTSGAISDAVMRNLAVGARVVICGTAAISSWDDWPQGPRVERHLLLKRARMQGFLMHDFNAEFPEALAQLTEWVRAGKLHYREDISHGLESCPGALARIYRGGNVGKCLIGLD